LTGGRPGRSTDKTQELDVVGRPVGRLQGLSVDWPGRSEDVHRRARPWLQGPVDQTIDRSGLK